MRDLETRIHMEQRYIDIRSHTHTCKWANIRKLEVGVGVRGRGFFVQAAVKSMSLSQQCDVVFLVGRGRGSVGVSRRGSAIGIGGDGSAVRASRCRSAVRVGHCTRCTIAGSIWVHRSTIHVRNLIRSRRWGSVGASNGSIGRTGRRHGRIAAGCPCGVGRNWRTVRIVSSRGGLLDGYGGHGRRRGGRRLNDRRTLDTKVQRREDHVDHTTAVVQTSQRQHSLSRHAKRQLVQVREHHLTEQIIGANEVVIEHRQANAVLLGRSHRDNELLVPDRVQVLLDLRRLPNLRIPAI